MLEQVSKAVPRYADRKPRNLTQRKDLELAARNEPAYAKALMALARRLSRAVKKEDLLAALASRTPVAQVVAKMPWWDSRDPGAEPVWSQLSKDLAEAYRTSVETRGQATVDALPGKRKFSFRVEKAAKPPDISVPPNPHSLTWIRQRSGDLIKNISDEQKQLLRNRIAAGYAKGERPENMVASIRRNIGLTERQGQAVERRRELVLERTGNERLADKAADGYSEEQLELRARTIARTENKAAQSQGQQDAWLVAREEGLLPANTRRRWVSMPESPRLSDICRELDGQVVGLDESFHSEVLDEDVEGPPAHPNCRSTIVLEFTDE